MAVDTGAVCMFCGDAPCTCAPKTKSPARTKKQTPVVAPLVVTPPPPVVTEFSNEIVGPKRIKPIVNTQYGEDFVYAVNAIINAGLVEELEARRLKAAVGLSTPIAVKESIRGWKQRRKPS